MTLDDGLESATFASGMLADMLSVLASELNFTYLLVRADSVHDIVRQIESNETVMSANLMVKTGEHMPTVDFSNTIDQQAYRIMYRYVIFCCGWLKLYFPDKRVPPAKRKSG